MLKRGLIQFVPPNFSADATALVIDDEKYLAPLRELMPAAKITLSLKAVEPVQKFDVIITENHRLLIELNSMLKDTGFLLTQFSTLNGATKSAVINLLTYANYKESHFYEDRANKVWLVKACKSTAEVAALKEFYTDEIRAELSRLIHRVEYGIDVDENISRIKNLCRRENIFADYFNDFVAQVTCHEEAKKFLININEV